MMSLNIKLRKLGNTEIVTYHIYHPMYAGPNAQFKKKTRVIVAKRLLSPVLT